MINRALLTLSALVAVVGLQAAEPELPLPVRTSLDIRQVPHDSLSVFVQDLDSGEVILSWNDQVARNPGSTIKLLTTMVALDILGPAYTWNTDVFVMGDVENGRLDGDLLLKGYGDPFLVTERVWQLLRQGCTPMVWPMPPAMTGLRSQAARLQAAEPSSLTLTIALQWRFW